MADIFEKPYLTDLGEFIRTLSGSRLLSACGGPYPARPDVKIIESWKLAIDLITDAMLDAIPHHELDRVLVKGRRAARVALGRTWLRSLVDGGMTKEERELERSIKQIVSSVSSPLFQGRAELSAVQEHLVGLLTTTSLLLRADKLVCFRDVALAADLAVLGYLPIDLVSESKNSSEQRVVIY